MKKSLLVLFIVSVMLMQSNHSYKLDLDNYDNMLDFIEGFTFGFLKDDIPEIRHCKNASDILIT